MKTGVKLVVALALLGGFARLVLRPHEVAFEGKPLRLLLLEDLHGPPYYPGSYYGVAVWRRRAARNPRAERAVRALGTNALPVLVEMAASRESFFRMVLGQMALDRSMDYLHLPPQYGKHEVAAWAFKLLGPAGRPAVPVLARLLEDRDPSVRMAAADCLAGIGPEAREAVPGLIRALQAPRGPGWNQDQAVAAAAYALGEIGPAAAAAIPFLAGITNDAAQVALIKIRQGSFQAFFERLKDTSKPDQWCLTAQAVSLLGTNADPAIPSLLAAFQNTNSAINQFAVDIVGKLHRRPDLCLDPLVSLLESTNSNLRWSALLALAGFGSDAKQVLPRLLPYLTNHERYLRECATNALGFIAPEVLKGKGK